MTEKSPDPETAPAVRRAAHYLTTITEQFLEFGPLWEKTPADLVYELDYHNAWHQYEIDQERKRGEQALAYHEVRLVDLQALSQQNVRALAERGEHDSEAYRIAQYVDELIAAALAQAQEIEQRLYTPLESVDEDVPF